MVGLTLDLGYRVFLGTVRLGLNVCSECIMGFTGEGR